MKERVNKSVEITYDRAMLTRAINLDLLKTLDPQKDPKVESIEITEVSIPPNGVFVKVIAKTSVIDEVPDKIFAPPTRS